MAFLAQNPDDNGQNQNNLTPQTGQQPAQGIGVSSPIPTGGGAPSGQPAQQAPVGAPAPQQKGSGRFTNLQKYINANQGAGQTLTAGVQKGIEKSLNPLRTETQTQAQTGQQNIQQAGQTLQTGTGLQQQMAAGDFTPQKALEFANQAGNVEQVGKFRTGQAIDEAALQAQNLAYQQAAATLGQKVGEKGQAVGSEIGRMGLLKDVYGGKGKGNYGTGNSRLDNLLLQSSGQNISNLQSNIQAQKQIQQDLQTKALAQGKSVEQVAADEAKLAQQTEATTTGNIEKFKTGLGGQVEGFNTGIESAQKSGNEFLDFYNKSTNDDQFKQKYGVTKAEYQKQKEVSDLFDKFGLKENQQTFNVFNNPELNLQSVADLEARRAKDWRDVAQQSNVSEYDALARLRGLDRGQYELDKASDINKEGYSLANDDRSVQGRIKAQQQKFLEDAANDVVRGHTGWVEGTKGYSSINPLEFLMNPEFFSNARTMYQTREGDQFGAEAAAAGPEALKYARQVYGLDNNQQTAPQQMGTGSPEETQFNPNFTPQFMGANINSANPYNDVSGDLDNYVKGIGDVGTIGTALSPAALPLMFGGETGNAILNSPANVLNQLYGGISGMFGGNGESRGDEVKKGSSYVKSRSLGDVAGYFAGSSLGYALGDYLKDKGFGNYSTREGSKELSLDERAGPYTLANLDDISSKFGYRLNPNGTAGPNQTGYFQQARPTQATQEVQRSAPMTAEEALAAVNQLKATNG